MSKSARLRLSDLRTLYEITNECRDLGDDPVAWRQHFAQRLGNLGGAAVVTTLEVKLDGYEWLGFSHWGWETSGLDLAAWGRLAEAASRETPMINPMLGRYLEVLAEEDGVSLTREDLVSDHEFYSSKYFQEYHSATGADAQLNCFRSLPADRHVLNAVILVRPSRVADFRPKDRALVHEANALITPLIGGPLVRFAEPSPSELPPRVRQVLRCLLEGDGDKQIAARLKLSAHTVNEYVKRIFTHFSVASRTELLARWVRRGWGKNGPAWADVL